MWSRINPVVNHQLYIKAADLNNWSNTRQGQEQLPLLIRRLVRTTAIGLRCPQMASDESIHQGGWDGIVYTEQDSEWVPKGPSGWEFSVEKGVAGKADSDYIKRKSDPLGLTPSESTYIAVTSRNWSGKGKWANAKKSEMFWKDVRAYDSNDLATWLESVPALLVWASRLLGKLHPGVKDLWQFWEQWSQDSCVDEDILLAGRAREQSLITDWLLAGSGINSLRAETKDHATGFVYATLQNLEPVDRERLLSRAVKVENQQQFDWLSMQFDSSLLLIPSFPEPVGLRAAESRGHKILIPLSADERATGGVTLPAPRIDQLREALKKLAPGLGRNLDRAAAVGHKSFSAMQRFLPGGFSATGPKWLSVEILLSLLPAYLAGSWSSKVEGDRIVLSYLAGQDYEAYSKLLSQWLNVPDPFLSRTEDAWVVIERAKFWGVFAQYVDADTMLRFRQACESSFFQKDRPCSALLRKGLLECLCIMGELSSNSSLADSSLGQDWAEQIVSTVGSKAESSDDWKLLSFHAHHLAEAAPGPFLNAVGPASRISGPLSIAFDGNGDNQVQNQPLTCLIRGLRLSVWSKAHFIDATCLLAKFAERKWQSRYALESLQHIFEAVAPECNAPYSVRLCALEKIRSEAPRTAWELMLRILPFHQRVFTYLYTDHRTSEWPATDSVPFSELYRYIHEIFERLFIDASADVARWSCLVPLLTKMTDEHFLTAIRALAKLLTDANYEQRVLLAEPLGRLIGQYHKHGSENWTLSSERALECQNLYRMLQPKDGAQSIIWRLQRDIGLLEQPEDWEYSFTRRKDWEKSIVKEAYLQGSLNLILELLELGVSAGELGWALSFAELSETDELIVLGWLGEDGQRGELALSFLFRLTRNSPEFADRLKTQLDSMDWNSSAKADFMRCLPLCRDTWDFLAASGHDVSRLYWKRVGLDFAELATEDQSFVEEMLTANGRAADALRRLHRRCRYRKRNGKLVDLKSPRLLCAPDTLLHMFEQLLIQAPIKKVEHPRFLVELLNMTSKSQRAQHRQRFEELERKLMEGGLSSGFKPLALHDRITKDPLFFSQEVMSEDRFCRYEVDQDSNKWRLIESYKKLPGRDRSMNLSTWVSKARSFARDQRSLYLIDNRIGTLLSYAKVGNDGYWPEESVRDLIEKTASESIESGLRCALINNQGMTCRGVLDGGEIERRKEDDYRKIAEEFRPTWPRTAALLDSIADKFQRRALQEDRRANLHQALWNH